MKIPYKLRILHKLWRYRLNTEKESIQYLLSRKIQGTTAIDIGANYGIYSYWLSKQVGTEGSVLSFEPQPELVPKLELMQQAFDLDNITLVNKGLSNEHGCMMLYRKTIGCGGASFEYSSTMDEDITIKVEVVRLDDYLEDNSLLLPPVSFIKADVEGHEQKVFEGAKSTILKYKPVLLFECDQYKADEGELFSLLVEYGYEGFFFHGKERIHYEKYDQYPYRKEGEIHRNYVFIPGDSVE